ncbi:hypothetical protein ACIO1C_00980 [Streptomyces sp. NPDC087420]
MNHRPHAGRLGRELLIKAPHLLAARHEALPTRLVPAPLPHLVEPGRV